MEIIRNIFAVLTLGIILAIVGWLVYSASLALALWINTPNVYLTNEQIIAETKKCEDAGLDATTIYNGFNYKVWEVICKPKQND